MIEMLQEIIEFFRTGLFEWFESVMAQVGAWVILIYFKLKLSLLSFSYEVAGELLNQLNISALLQSAWSTIDSEILGAMTYFRIPEGLNLVISAQVTAFVFRFFS